jgi:ABC-type Fe3+/spermidine/putrescine transport system ATPase subunit
VLEDVSFSAPEGAITAVLGLAGAGKTSLLAAIAGLVKSERGAVFQGGADLTRISPRKRDVAFLPPGTVLPEARPLSHGEALHALTTARLARIAGCCLIDEAGMGLDPNAADALADLLRARALEGRVVVLATRSPALALLADHLVLLDSGHILQAGTPASVYAEPQSVAAALLTGPANILQGHIRELRPGGFVWAGGGRYLQTSAPETRRPALGSLVTLCLRPERVGTLADGEVADNMAEADIIDVRAAGPRLDVRMNTPLGPWRMAVPSWRPPLYPVAGQRIRIGWPADAALVLG